ncbi:JAB domain-containing protein, partial [Akkermansia sp.]
MFSVPDTGSKTVFEAAPSPAAGSSLSAKGRSSFFLSPDTEGVLEPGNIDLRRRPVVRNRDGSVSMARSFSVAKDGREYLIPTVSDEGRLLSDQEAISQFEKTGRHLGAFRTAQDAAEYADRMDRQQEILYAANPQEFQGVEIQQGSLVAGFPARLPGEAATPLSPVRPRSLFDRPLTASPLLSSSARMETAYRPDPQRMEELNALVLHFKHDPELDALLERNPAYRSQAALDDGSMPARALLGQQILREVAGERYEKEPGFYFLALKEKLPEAATRQEAYAAVYDHYRKAVEKQYEENKARKAAYQKNRAQVDEAVAHVVGGLWSPAELGVRLTPEQTDVYLKEFDTGAVEKAHAAFSLLKDVFSGTPEDGLRRMVSERAAMKITSALSDDDGTGKLTINETAFNLFEGSLRKLMGAVKEQSGDEWKFLHNVKLALFNPVAKRNATLGTLLQIERQQNSLVPFAHEHNDRVLEMMDETIKEYQTYIKNDRENARVLGLLSTGQDLGNQSNERASFAAKTVNCLGSVCGQTASFFLPYAGWGVALAGAYDDKRNRAYYEGLEPGTAEWSAFVDAAASVAVEKISYGALGRLSGAGWVMGKLPFMGKARKALTDSLWKHVLFEAGAGMVEETFVEPTAEAIIQWAVRSNIAPLAGVDVGGSYDWSNYWNELKGMMEPDQLLATALFVGGLAGGTTGANSLIMQRSLVVNSRSPEMLMTQGIPADEAKRISGITDNGERVAAVREAVSKLRTLPPDVVRKNAGEGVKAFRSLAEVRATVESEAYKFFQKEMRLPLVEEKLDKPGMYNVTVFDVDSGQKKFTQEMAEGQLVSLFGNYFSEDKRAQIAEAHSAFAANAFLRTAEKGNVVQAQDMLQWGKSTGEEKGAGVRKTPEEGMEGNGKEDERAAGKVESGLSPEAGSPGVPVPAATERETREGEDSSASLGDDSAVSKDGAAARENLSVLGKFIRTVGGLSQTGFSYLTRIALDEWNRRLDSGMSGEQAAAAPFAPLSPYAPLGSMLGLEKAFKERLKIAARTTGEEGSKQTSLFQMRTAPGTSPADILFLVSKGLVGTREMLEDLFEVGIKNLVKGDRARLEAVGGLLRETQAGLQKLGFQGQFISPSGPLDEMKVVEGMSKLALSDTLANAESLPLPRWQKDLLQYHVNYLNDASYLLNLGRAWNLGREKGTITKSMEDILRDLGHRVHTIYDQARIEQQDIQAVMEARAIVFGNRGGPGGSAGGPTASQIRERQQRDEEEEKAHVTTGDRSKERTVPKEALQHPETVALPEAPESMQGVFVNGAAYNPDAGTWLGMVPVDKLHLSPEVPQVKVNSGKKGVVNPLVGDYRADAPPVYVWKRKNGKLEVVSGRHRLDLARRTGMKAIAAYVYEEDADHDARWARLLDYEQNMQDDQADELTAAIYVRETGLTDDELTRRGLTRAGTRSRRGLLIGREAREDLWTRFRSGAIRAQDAEAICLLTRHIQDKGRIDAMQMAAANDLAGGKSLEFVAAKMQLMAHASADGGMVQGLISFGDSFEQDMERAAEYVARSIGTINEHINAIKGVRNISKKGNVLATEGITAGLSEDPAERLKELELLKTMYEKIGLYENLRVRALTWDGKSAPDPIGDHRLDMQAERARAEADAAALEDEGNRKAAEALTPELGFSLMLSRNLETVFPDLWNEAARELNDRGHVSFALNGSRVSIHSLSGKNFREALEMEGLFPPVNRGADFSSGLVSAGEIACVLHPESVGADSRSVPLPEGAAGSGRRVPLSDFSGFVIPSSQEESLLPALLELGVPVRVYHVTGEEAAFLGDPRSMEKDDLRKKKELDLRRNNVIRSFLEETDVSFSLSAAERRIFTRARREDTWMKAPDGTPTALTERQWLQVHSEAFREWFGESKIVNEHGEPVVVYHGTARADRVGTVFRGERATSGPMAFFTDNEGIAANYAKDKRDTSIGYEEEDYHDYHQQFRVVLPDGQDIPLERYWNYLSLSDQRRIASLAGQIRKDWDGDNSIIVDPSINDANGGFPEHLREARGNAFRALVYHWLESAILFDEEHRFLDVLEKLDLPLSPYYRDPNYQEPKVYACYMRMENPFRTPRITKKIVASLKAASRKAEIARESWRTDLWDKNSVSPEDWIERLEGDYENKTTHAWASIPDWVTAWLRKKGYDGIIDQGGKFHAEDHTVCIPFDSVQIKSARDNRGTFDSGNPDITFSIGSEKRLITLRAKKDGTWLNAPNGKPSLLSPRLWSIVRTRAFREWFGDWVNDPANASRVVDENGEPMVVYHGSNYKFTEFDPSFAGSNYDRQELDFGFLFTTTDAYHAGFAAKTAREFENERRFARGERLLTDRSGREYALFANLRNPLIYDLDAHPEELSYGFPETEPDVWDSPRFALRAQKEFYEGDDDGNDYDGILLKGRESSWVLARKSNQLKSATNNRGTYDAADSDITFSLSNLAAVHSLNTEKLAAADKLGGLPLPSLAVTRLDRPYTWGDDDNVYLVGSPALADPARGVEIYDRDMWSGHFPELRWNRREEQEREEFYRKAEQAALRYYGGADISTLRFLKDALDGDHRGALESKLRTNDLSLAVFAGERGYAPRPLMTKIPGRLNTGDRIFYSEIRKMRPDKHANFLAVERQEEFCAAMERAIERYRTQFVRDSQENKSTISQTLVGKINLSEMEKELKEAREDNFDVISHLALIDASQFGKTVPDWSGNFKRFEKYAATHKKAFDAWVKDKMDRWLNPVPRIKENGFPATLENVTRYMLGSKGNGAEYKDSFFPTGLLRAKKSRRFHSLDQIKENRDILVTSDEYDASQEEAQGLIQKFQETLFGIVNDFSAYNKAVEALSLIEGEPTPSKVLSALSRLYRGSSYRSRMARNSGNLLGLGAAALHAMKSELRDYYEAVPQRAVQLQEFSHAVMPASLRKNKQIRDILKRHGIRPLYHDGTLEGRTRAMASLMGSAASFSLTSGGDSGGTSEAFSDSSRFRFPASDFMVSLSEEERDLSEKALASGTWLKAPNGEDSRLTPRQWVQVRTAAFRDWFGDWLDDPGHASQVVDENGEPRVVYHGTPVPYDPRYGWVDAVTYRHMPAPFSVFGEGNWHGAKFFFDDYNSARYFASNKALDMEISEEAYTFECFLNARKLFNIRDKEAVIRIIDSFPDSVPVIPPQFGSVEHVSREAASGLVKTFQSWILTETKEFQQKLQELGYDGFVAADHEYYTAVFKSSQIKSATENVGSFDPASPDITFSVIGPNAATWKRYKENVFSGRDDGKMRAEIDASQAVLKDRSASYLEPLRRELAALRRSVSGEMKKKITRFLELHGKFYRNEKDIEAEDYPDLWREYLSLDREREGWSQLLTKALLRTGLYRQQPAGAAVQAQLTSSLEFLLEEDDEQIRALASRGADNTVMTLGEWLDYPELFAAYPKLRSMPVIFRYLEEGVRGQFSPAEWTISLDRNTSDPQNIRSTLLHEIQHAIQQIEGFAKGGSPEAARQFYEFMRRDAKEAYEQSDRFVSWLNARDGMISTLEYMLSLARNPHRVLRTAYLYSYDNVLRRLEGEERILDMVRYALGDMSGLLEKFYQEDWNRDAKFDLPWPDDYALNTPAGIKECLEAAKATPSRRLAYRRTPKPDLGSLYRNFLKYEKLSGLSSHELYSRLAGEIEARNVQFRHDWSADFREDVPFNDSLEYPGEALVSFSLSLTENRPSEDFLSSLSEEERVLAERSWEDGTWLLAPNGEASRLTSRQWLQVRTAAFKRWFGDWEHDPLEASRVVDDNGEPLVVYHGARHAGFTVFDSEQAERWSQFGTPEGCFFFSDNRQVAASYSNPAVKGKWTSSAVSSPEDSFPAVYACFLNIRVSYGADFQSTYWDSRKEAGEAGNWTAPTTNTIALEASEQGYDGAILLNVIDMGDNAPFFQPSTVYAVFQPEFIKSATQNRGTFDPRNPDITFSLAGSLAVQRATSGTEPAMDDSSGTWNVRTFRIVREKFGGWRKDSVNIDLGSGRRGEFSNALEGAGVACYAYDPFGSHASHEAPVLRELRTGALQGDTVTCNDVLNLIPNRTARFHVIHQAARSLKPDGTAFFSIDEGDGNGQGRIVKTLSGLAACWQENRKAESYLGEVRSFFEDVKLKDGLIVARSPRRTSPPALWRQGREMQVLPQISVAALQKEGYFPQGVLKTANAVITEPGAVFSPAVQQELSFSITAEHASPSSFRKFREEAKEEERRALNYGWGLYFTEDPLKSRAYEKDFRSTDDEKEAFYLIDGERNHSSAFSPDERDILDEIFTNGWDNINSYVERNRDVMELYGVYRTALDKYRGKTVERVWKSLPSSTVSSYRVELNVGEADLLTWEDDVPPVLLDTALTFLKEAHPEFHAEIIEYQSSSLESGGRVPVRLFCPRLQENMGKKEASKWLVSQGIKGLRYYNGERTPGKKYDYVIFDEDDIKITGVRDASTNWKNFSPYHDSSASFSVIGPRAETWRDYGERAFVGRDDGKMRAEIDASQARLDMESIYERDYSELDDMTGMFTATSDIKPLIGTRAARFYSEAREVSQAYRAGKISDEELNGRYRQLLHKWGFQQEAALVDSDEFHNALQEVVAPVIQAVHDVWDFFIKHFLTANAAYVIDWKRESRSAAFNNLVFFMATGDYRFIHAIFPKAGPYKTWMLGEVLDYPELFKAYPVLKGIKVDFREMQIKEVVGELNSFENRLSLSIYALENKSADEIRSYLLHEVQHAIQDIEGFASGGNFITAPRVFFEEIDRTRSVLNLYLVHLKSGISHLEEAFRIARDPAERAEGTLLYKQYLLEGRTMTDERKRSLAAHFLDKTVSRAREDLNSDVPEGVPLSLRFPAEQITLPTAQEAMEDKGKSLHKVIAQAEALLDPLYFAALKAEERYMEREQRFEEIGGNVGAYLRLGGEIESRNVEHRKDWSAERRAAEPFNDTLEYPGEALVSFSLGDGLSPAPESHSLPGSSPLQDVSQNASQDSQNSQDSLQNEYETEQSIHASSGRASFTERTLLPRTGEGHPGRGHSDESAGSENPGAGEGSPTGNAQAGSALSGQEASGETNAAHSGQFDPAVGVLGIKAYSLSPHLTELAVRNNFYTGDIIEIENSAEGAAHFRRCLEEAKSSQVYGECVYTYDAEEYEHMRLFLLPSGKAGFALKDGDMVSVFSHKRHGHVGKPSYALVALAVQMGAIKGDCYGTILPDLYAQFGFRAVARDRFNAEFAPESMQEPAHMERWYSDQGGKPDVVYLVYKGNRARVVEEFDPEAESGFESLPYSDFDACLEIQSRAVETQRNREAADSVSFSISSPERYKDGDGKIIRHWSLGAPSNDPLLKRKPLKGGEFCRVERIFRKSGAFEFSSRNRVESTADIAYIFRQLENASVENVFAVYIKDGQPIVQHISMGGIDSCIVEYNGIVAAMGRLKPEAFYLVHNHPSGSLKASAADINTHQRMRRMFGDIVEEGIIIDTTSGYFAVFDSASPRERSTSPMPGQSDKEQPVSLYAFDRAVFAPDWNPSKIARISGPKDIAAFISGHRLGKRKKISLLIFNNQLQIVANIHTRYTSLSSPGLPKHIAECTAVYGGWQVAVYGDFTDQAASLSVSPQEGFNELQSRLQPFYESANLVDAIQVNGNHYSSLVSSYSSYVKNGERDISSFSLSSGYGESAVPAAPDTQISPDSTFSLTSIQKVVSSLTAPSMQATRAAELVKDCDKAAENWRRIMSGKAERPSARVGAELFGMVGAFLSAARYVLPEGYRSNVDMQMQWASVYAAMAESGQIPPKGTLRSGEAIYKKFEESMINNTTTAANAEEVRDILAAIGSQRLDRVMGKILDRVRGQLIRFAKDELYLNTMKRVEVIYPKKEIGKKSPRGRMEAQAYRAVARYREMLGAAAEVKAEAMEALEAKYNTEEDEEKRLEHEEDIIAWKTYGDYKGMSLPQAQAAMEKLLEFVMAGRNSWADKLRKEGGRTKYAARQIQKNLPAVNSGSSRAGAKIEHRTKLRKLLASLPYSFMSYAQLMLALEPVLGQRFSRARIKEISDANASLLNASNDRSAWLFDTICCVAGVKSESEAEQWLVKFNTPEKTDIPIAPVIPVKVTLSIEDAEEWLSLSKEERDARRKEIRENDKRTETVTENVPEEEDILLLRQALDEYEKKSPEQRQYQKNVTSRREVPNEDATGILTCSRDCALYAILLHEQPDYADMYDEEGNMIRKGFLRREGLDDAGISALYDFVGTEGMEYGYALRKRLQETGKTLAKVYEERMGVPFTFKENYFRATFDRNSTKEKDALTEPKTGSIGGGKYGLLIDRIIHSENLDFSKAGTLVFLAAAAEQDNYIYTSHITTAWRALLKNKVLEQKLKQYMGEDMMGKLSAWMDLIDGASLENNRAFLNLSRMQGMLQKAFAVSVLAGNGYVLLKQSSAILHGFFAGWVPSDVLERADGTRELAHRHISFADYLFHLAASKMGLGDIGLKEVMATPYFQARVRGKGAMLAQIGNQMPGQRYSRMEKLPEKAMDLIEWVDVKANLLAMHALANAYYAKAKALNETNGSPFTDEQLRKAALEQVGMSLELGAQPLTKTQKSMNQAAGGILSKLAFVMKSEQLNKLGMMAAEWKTGSARNRVCAVQSWLALGVTSSLLAWLIAWIKGLDDDDDKEKKWKKYGTTALLGDLTTIPLAGEGVNYLASLITGERVFADSYARTLVDVQGIARTVKKEYEHVADKKEMDWDTHF